MFFQKLIFALFQTRKNSPTHIKRPMNAFMVFSHHERKKVIAEDIRLENTQISKELGRRWKNLSEEEREPYIQEADKLKQYHLREYPDYKYKPTKKKLRTKYPSEENPGPMQRPSGVMRSNSGPFSSSSGINVSYGGPLRSLDPNRFGSKITINRKFKTNLISIHQKSKKSFLQLEPPGSAPSELSPPAKVPGYSPGHYPTTPDSHSQPFYADTRLETLKHTDHAQYSPLAHRVPMSPMTRSCPVTPLSRPYQQYPLTPDQHRSITKPPSPLYSSSGKQEQPFTWDLDSASLPDLTSFLDSVLPSTVTSSELSLDVGDLKLDFTEPDPGAGVVTQPSNSIDITTLDTELDLGTDIDSRLMEFIS